MTRLLSASSRGATRLSWLDSRHSFSFGDYYNPASMGFGVIRVLNDDRVRAGTGFATHPHADTEILTYVVRGSLAHADSTGTSSVIQRGDVQRLSAGTGVMHSERNPSSTEAVHFLQIWILPEWRGLPPSYEQKSFPEAERRGRLVLVASRGGRDGSLSVHQDVNVWAGLLERGEVRELPLAARRRAWVQVAKGEVRVNGTAAREGDGVAITDEPQVKLEGERDCELLVFEMA